MLIGDKWLLRDKILYQYEIFNLQRLTSEVDNGNQPDRVNAQLEKFAYEVMPYIKKHTKN